MKCLFSAICLLCAVSATADVVWLDQTTTQSTKTADLYPLACDLAEAAGFAPCGQTCLPTSFPESSDTPPPNFIPSGRGYTCTGADHPICDHSGVDRCGFSAYRLPACPSGKFIDEHGTCQDPEKEQGPSCGPHSPGPIYFGSGNKYLSATDYKGMGPLALEWTRSYNGLDRTWRFTYSHKLESVSSTEKLLWRATGYGIRFKDVLSVGTWIPDSDINTKLEYDAGTNEWTATFEDDSVEVFNSSGDLLSITNRAGQTINLGYTSGQLTNVTHFSGRSITLTYGTNGLVEQMTDPAGFVYKYEYDVNGMLEYVIFPDDTPLVSTDNPRMQYHYEDANYDALVTGMTDETGTRYSTYAYDSLGRATLSERAGGVESTSVAYNANGTVTVTNELGKDTIYTFEKIEGVRRVTDIDGQGTALCDPTMKTVSYDSDGFANLKTDENGVVTDYDYNARGLVTQKIEGKGTSAERITSNTWHSTFRVPTETQRLGQTIEMEYDAEGRILKRTIKD